MKKDEPRSNIGNVRALAALLLAPLFALGVASVAVGIVGGVVREPIKPNSIVWSQRVFTSQKDLAAWLEGRGGRYETWANRHPSLASVFEKQTPGVPLAAPADTHRRNMLLAPLVAAVALLLLLGVRLADTRYPRRPRAAPRRRRSEARTPREPRQPRVRETVTPAFVAVRAGASSVGQVGRATSPHLRSVVRAGVESMADIHYALTSPHGRRRLRSVVLYTASAIFAVALGASVAIYFP